MQKSFCPQKTNGGGVAETEEAEAEEKGDWKKTSRISCLVSPFAVVEGGREEGAKRCSCYSVITM